MCRIYCNHNPFAQSSEFDFIFLFPRYTFTFLYVVINVTSFNREVIMWKASRTKMTFSTGLEVHSG